VLRVSEVLFIERSASWAVALEADGPEQRLEVGQVLVHGSYRWRVAEVHEAPNGLLAGRLDGVRALTRGLIVRPADEPMGDAEFRASMVLLVRLFRALRDVDLDGLVARLAETRSKDSSSPLIPLAKSAVLAKHVQEHGASLTDLDAAARVLGIGDEL
jgi:hypothetical protein